MGISNTAGTLSGAIGLEVTGKLLDWGGGAQNVQGWYTAGGVSAAVVLIAAAIF